MMIKKRYFFRFVILMLVGLSALSLAEDPKEQDLIAVLKSDAPKDEKAITCKKLAIYGTEKAVPALEPLLADKELTSWARIALEAIPGSAPDTVLRNALGKLEGRLLVGTINSIAVRRDTEAVDPLIEKLKDADESVASAAAVALGHIGGDKAAAALTKSLADAPPAVRSAAAQGCILSAENSLANEQTAKAVKLYDAVRKADVPVQRHLEAIRGAILARGSDGLPLLIEQLRSQEKKRLGIGLRTARELPGRNVTEALAAELDLSSRPRRPLLLMALADRNDSAVLPAVKKAAKSGPKELRITAIDILIRLGDVSCIPILLEAAVEDDAQLAKAATEAIIRLPGKDVDADCLARLPKARGKQQQVLIRVAGQRQISQALPAVVASLKSTDAEIRAEAVRTVSIIGRDEQAADLVKMVLNTKDSNERDAIRKALMDISGRCGAKCTPHLMPLTKSSDNELRIVGLRALAVCGGPDALAAVKSAIESAEGQVQDEAVRILSNWPSNWPDDTEAGQALLKLATSAENMTHRVLGLRGYLQHIRGNKKLSNEQKVANIKDVGRHIKRPEEKRQAIAVLGEAPSAGALELLTALADDQAVVEEAYSAMVQIAGKDIAGVSKNQRREVLQRIAEKSKNNGTRQRAQKALNRLR
ncbi:MAG: HEAT repeat domain-containing protein [Planctomycetota bacterium]|jgi:HEAT repeat protein